MQITVGKLLALLIAIGYAVAIVVQVRPFTYDVMISCLAPLLPLGLIWFPEELGSLTGFIGHGGYLSTETPPIMVSFAGWFFLVGLPVIWYFTG